MRPYASAKAGASVLIGSEAYPTAATMSRNASSRLSPRTRRRISRSFGDGRRSCGRAWTKSSATTMARYEAELIANDAGMPTVTMASAASAGPTARARLNVIELSATAVGRSRSSTRPVTSAAWAGAANALATPRPSVNPITTHSVASPAKANTASVADRTAAASSETMRTCLRSNRSAAAPAQGESRRMAANCEKLRTPSRSSEPVSR